MRPRLTTPAAAARGVVQRAIASRVAGGDEADRSARERRIWWSPGERWFAEDDAIWRVHCDPSMFVGGIAALLLQSLHPLAMAGVAGHSGFRSDPWGRLQRTSTWIAVTTYAPAPQADQLVRAVRAIHDTVSGTTDDGRAYAASDPRLLAWVHAAEAWAFLHAHRRFGREALSPAEEDAYVAQVGTISQRLGFTGAPTSVAALEATLAAYRPELRATPAALDAADFLLRTPPVPLAARPGYAALAGGAVGLLPPWARRELGLDRAPWRERAAATAARGMTGLIGWAIDHPALNPEAVACRRGAPAIP